MGECMNLVPDKRLRLPKPEEAKNEQGVIRKLAGNPGNVVRAAALGALLVAPASLNSTHKEQLTQVASSEKKTDSLQMEGPWRNVPPSDNIEDRRFGPIIDPKLPDSVNLSRMREDASREDMQPQAPKKEKPWWEKIWKNIAR